MAGDEPTRPRRLYLHEPVERPEQLFGVVFLPLLFFSFLRGHRRSPPRTTRATPRHRLGSAHDGAVGESKKVARDPQVHRSILGLIRET